MKKRLLIVLLIVGGMFAQDDIESILRNHPYFNKHQDNIKDSFYNMTCKNEPMLLYEIENSIIPEILFPFFTAKISSIINTDNCYIEMDPFLKSVFPSLTFTTVDFPDFADSFA